MSSQKIVLAIRIQSISSVLCPSNNEREFFEHEKGRTINLNFILDFTTELDVHICEIFRMKNSNNTRIVCISYA